MGRKEGGAEEHVKMTLAIISIGVHCFVCGFTSSGLIVSLPAFSIRAGIALFVCISSTESDIDRTI